MAGFLGQFDHSIDAKGRLILPQKFRKIFEKQAYLTQHREGCLALWTPSEFERQLAEMRQEQKLDKAHRNRVRIWSAASTDVDIDAQGRIAIPTYLRTFARLDGKVLVNGAIDRVEIWSPAVWEERVQPEEGWFFEDDE